MDMMANCVQHESSMQAMHACIGEAEREMSLEVRAGCNGMDSTQTSRGDGLLNHRLRQTDPQGGNERHRTLKMIIERKARVADSGEPETMPCLEVVLRPAANVGLHKRVASSAWEDWVRVGYGLQCCCDKNKRSKLMEMTKGALFEG